uniref:Secreted protein n=1 Tax=Cacopsylla melanoneura TaxID=428564 RepID=A0A8D9BQP2_9HEMI
MSSSLNLALLCLYSTFLSQSSYLSNLFDKHRILFLQLRNPVRILGPNTGFAFQKKNKFLFRTVCVVCVPQSGPGHKPVDPLAGFVNGFAQVFIVFNYGDASLD